MVEVQWCSDALVPWCYDCGMARLTISLSDERHRQLKVRAALQGKTIGQLIEGALEDSEERHRQEARAILAKARANAAKAEPKLRKIRKAS